VQYLLIDWGNTVMRDLPGVYGPMHTWPRVEALPGVREALLALRPSFGLALATNAAESSESEIRLALERVELSALFDRVFCAGELGERKPDAAFFRAILGALGLPPASAFMVGDDFEIDVLGANAVGMRAVWLNSHTRTSQRGALHATIHDWSELRAALVSLGAVLVPTRPALG